MKNRKLNFQLSTAYGFSVVELIVALTIMTIIVTVGFSAYTYFQTDYGKVSRNLENLSKKDVSIKCKIYQGLIDSSDNICPKTDCPKTDCPETDCPETYWKAEISQLKDCLFNP